MIYFNPPVVLNLHSLVTPLFNKFIIFWYFILFICLYNLSLSIICYSFLVIDIFLLVFLFIFVCLGRTVSINLKCSTCDFISNSITNQITSCFCCFLILSFWRNFKWNCSRLFSVIHKFLTVITIFLAQDKYTYPFKNIQSFCSMPINN